jgi:anaerobic magnesium-protoporphyrin IX monomethyl ester cyclase
VESIKENYEFFKHICADAAYCQILTPYPKTAMREQLLEQGLVTNRNDYRKYNGMWSNVRTKHLDADQLQYQFWYQRQVVLGWWNPPAQAKGKGWLWTSIWRWLFKPLLKIRYHRVMKKYGWEGRYQQEVVRWERMNDFTDLEHY